LSTAIAFFEDLVEVGAGIDVVERHVIALGDQKRPSGLLCLVFRDEPVRPILSGVEDGVTALLPRRRNGLRC
jgi:hypothetical protein